MAGVEEARAVSDARSRFIKAMRAINAHMDVRFIRQTPEYVQAACEAFADAVCKAGVGPACCLHPDFHNGDMSDCTFSRSGGVDGQVHAACRAAIVKEVMGE